MAKQNDCAQFQLDELLGDMLAEQLLHQAKLYALDVFLRLIAKHLLDNDEVRVNEFINIYEKAFKDRATEIKNDNLVLNAIIKQSVKDEIGGITGVVWPQ